MVTEGGLWATQRNVEGLLRKNKSRKEHVSTANLACMHGRI